MARREIGLDLVLSDDNDEDDYGYTGNGRKNKEGDLPKHLSGDQHAYKSAFDPYAYLNTEYGYDEDDYDDDTDADEKSVHKYIAEEPKITGSAERTSAETKAEQVQDHEAVPEPPMQDMAEQEEPAAGQPVSEAAEPEKTAPEQPAPEVNEPEPPAMETPKGDSSRKLDVPKPVLEVMELLKAHYYTAYLVGECVYLMYIGEHVMDFDIVCNAEPDRILAIFERTFKVRTDQIERGELIIINGGMGISVSPFRSRIDGSGKPIYCRTIDEDMCRRTFTSETVAYNPDSGIYDPYDGLSCITAEKTVLKAIDEEKYEEIERERSSGKRKKRELPEKTVIPSFQENPESILTAMMKLSRGEAEISSYTLKNMNDNAGLIERIMPDEIARYFRRILLGRRAADALLQFPEIVFRIFPLLRVQQNFDQKSDYQEYTLYEHTARAVGYAVPDYQVRLALLLHAAGKPDCAADRGDYMTFYGHAERGVMLAGDALEEYGADTRTTEKVLFMIKHHDDHITPDNFIEFTEMFGAEDTRLLLLMQSANIRAKSRDELNERVSAVLRQLADQITATAAPARARTKRTATIEGLRGITDLLNRNGI